MNNSRPRGVSGKSLLHFAGSINKTDLQLMKEAIDNDCGQIDYQGWGSSSLIVKKMNKWSLFENVDTILD